MTGLTWAPTPCLGMPQGTCEGLLEALPGSTWISSSLEPMDASACAISGRLSAPLWSVSNCARQEAPGHTHQGSHAPAGWAHLHLGFHEGTRRVGMLEGSACLKAARMLASFSSLARLAVAQMNSS